MRHVLKHDIFDAAITIMSFKTKMKICHRCREEHPVSQFKPMKVNAKKLTKSCKNCRKKRSLSKISPTTKTGRIREWWNNWCKQPCIDCGLYDPRLIQGDHRLDDDKVHKLSDYQWWACHGGLEELKKESRKCVPRCIFCHRLRTYKDRRHHLLPIRSNTKKNIWRRAQRKRLREWVYGLKFEIGCCEREGCNRMVTPNNVQAFDFDHLNPEEKFKDISLIISQCNSFNSGKKLIEKELKICRLLCCACHHIKTNYESKWGYISESLPNKEEMQEQKEQQDPNYHERWYSLKDQEIDEPEQRTPEWFAMRKGKLSGSKLSQFLFMSTQEDRVKMHEEIFEGRQKEPFSEATKGYMKWGQDMEDFARNAMLNAMPNLIGMEAPMIQHDSKVWLSASPDGFYNEVDADGNFVEEGVIEIKCPAKTRKCKDEPIYYYMPQVYLEMACSGHKNAIFFVWGTDKCKGWKIRWDQSFWDTLSVLLEDMRNTKKDTAMSFDDFSMAQYKLKKACFEVCKNATPLFETEEGWKSGYTEEETSEPSKKKRKT